MSKLKILVFGEIRENSDLFVEKLNTLHKSKAGPFDAAFSVGVCSSLAQLKQASLPLPVYLHHVSDPLLEECKEGEEDPYVIAPNLFLLVRNVAGIWSLKLGEGPSANNLVVAACPPHVRVDNDASKPLLEKLQHVSYRGCDVLLSEEPPQGSESLLSDSLLESFDVADVALKARARYHFYPSKIYQQSPPFRHLASTTSTVQILHTGRLISLAPVSSVKDKAAKCVHALGMTPLLSMSSVELQQQQQQQGILPCPFTDAIYSKDSVDEVPSAFRSSTTKASGLSEASARRILAEEREKRDGSSALAQRWTLNNNKRRRNGDMDDELQQQQENDPNCSTLFVHGLHKDVSGRLQSHQGDISLLQAFSKWNAVRVRKPPNAATSSFAFVEFPSHELARQCLKDTGSEVVVTGVHLTLKWAITPSGGPSISGAATSKKRKEERLKEAEAKDSNTLYFKLVQQDMNEASGEAMRNWAEVVLEAALNENVEEEEDRVTAQDEPALRVQIRIMEKFGFLDFASHAAASMAIATLSGSVDGGQVLEDAKSRPSQLSSAVIYMHWAHAKASQQNQSDKNVIEDTSGFKFERKHFPPDSRQDCWFCLASDSCEKHLITGVFDRCYAAMPKGPVHPGHLLLIPVQHTSQGALKDALVAQEMEDIKGRLRQHASSAYDCDLFVFERAIQTKGGYHTHVQCVPVERQLGQRLLTTMIAQGKKAGIDLKEINSDIGVSALLDSGDDDEAGYFYAEIPALGSSYRRFLFRHLSGSRANVPLQFGREVLAAVIGKPELAHWKSCVLDKEQEAKLATEFRESFAKID